jgi:hypothetical protein
MGNTFAYQFDTNQTIACLTEPIVGAWLSPALIPLSFQDVLASDFFLAPASKGMVDGLFV